LQSKSTELDYQEELNHVFFDRNLVTEPFHFGSEEPNRSALENKKNKEENKNI
jgi:hypothetical protein